MVKILKGLMVDILTDFSVIVLGGGMLFPPCFIMLYIADLDYSPIKIAFLLSTIAVILGRVKRIGGDK